MNAEAGAIASADRLRGFAAAAVVVACWSGFNIVSRLGSTGVLTPFDLAAMRFAVSGLLALPVFLVRVPRREWPRHLALAVFGGLGYALPVYSGFAFAPTAHAGVFVNGGIPFWTVLMVGALAGFKIARHILLALLLSSCGLVLIAYDSLFAAGNGRQWIGDLLFLAAAWSWAVFGLLVRRWRIAPPLAICGIASFCLALYLPAYLLWLPKAVARAGAGEIALQCVYQGIVAALLAAGMYSYANQKIGACQASMMLALVPGVSAVGAWFALGERPGSAVVLGIAVVSLGALLGALPGEGARRRLERRTAG